MFFEFTEESSEELCRRWDNIVGINFVVFIVSKDIVCAWRGKIVAYR